MGAPAPPPPHSSLPTPKAVAKVTDDAEELLTFYEYPRRSAGGGLINRRWR
jgi:hypothetical protein